MEGPGFAAGVERENSFMFIGGLGLNLPDETRIYSDKIYQWSDNDGQWLEMPVSLSEGKNRVTAIRGAIQLTFWAWPSFMPKSCLEFRDMSKLGECPS